MKLKDLQALKKKLKSEPSHDADVKGIATAKQKAEKLKTALKTAETTLKPVED